ncbi:DUF6510 family protein [Microbacterium sp. NPDC091313]
MSEHAPVIIVDGNAVAGMLADALAGDATMMAITCGCCGDRAVLAETVVEREPTSALVRCRSCTHTLFTLAEEPDALVLRVGRMDLRLPR